MNPMLRWASSSIHDTGRKQEEEKLLKKKRDAQRVKIQQEKERRRLDAIERDNRRRVSDHEVMPDRDGEDSKSEESAAHKFQKELCWCIQQLELGLVNMKPNAKQAQEAERLLKILKSSKAPMAKKRQVMRASFGNYRARMQQEEKKHSEVMNKKRCLTPVESDKLSNATFFKCSSNSLVVSPKFVNVQPAIFETKKEEEEKEDMEKQGNELEEEEDILMKSLELETMDMHINKQDCDSNKDNVVSGDNSELSIGDNAHPGDGENNSEQSRGNGDKDKNESSSRTPKDVNQCRESSMFCFNFEILEENMDLMEASQSQIAATTNVVSNEKDPKLIRGLDNRASDSTSSSGGTPPKKGGRRRNKGKKKQQQQKNNENQDNQENESKPSAKEAALLTESPKIELAARDGFTFDFPDPVESSGI